MPDQGRSGQGHGWEIAIRPGPAYSGRSCALERALAGVAAGGKMVARADWIPTGDSLQAFLLWRGRGADWCSNVLTPLFNGA